MTAPIVHPRAIPPMPAVARILSRFDREAIEHFVEIAIDLADALDGDAEAEELVLEGAFVDHRSVPAVQDPEAEGGAWIEWTTLHPQRRSGSNVLAGHEDDEEDDPAGQYDEDYYTGPIMRESGAGCPISDPGGDPLDNGEEEVPFDSPEPYYLIDQRAIVTSHRFGFGLDLENQRTINIAGREAHP